MGWLPLSSAAEAVHALADQFAQAVGDPEIDLAANRKYLMQAALSGYAGNFLQPFYARAFKGMSENDLDRVLQSFALKSCRPNDGLLHVLRKHMLPG